MKKQKIKREINFNNKTIKTTKDDFEELYHLITNQNPITKIEKINTSKPEFTIDEKKGKTKGLSKSKYTASDNETLGFIGEIIVLESLKKKIWYE